MSVFRIHAPMRVPAKRSPGTSATDDARAKAKRTGVCLDCGAMVSRKSLF